MIYAFIDEQRVNYSVRRLCHGLNVSPSGYYAWQRRPPSQRQLVNQALLVHIRAIHAAMRQTYGSPRIHAELRAHGWRINLKRVVRLMRVYHIQAHHKRKYRVTTQVDRSLPVAPNRLAQHFQADRPNQKWVTDVTCVPTAEGWLYLAAVLDLCSRRIIGWAMSPSNDTALVLCALQMALGRRQPSAHTLHHSDRAKPYASASYREVLDAQHFTASMSGTGNCYDNAPMESFFGTLKVELIHQCRYHTRDEARQDIVEYIEGFYNARRRHSALGYRSPLEFELAMA
jgi:putative transposase